MQVFFVYDTAYCKADEDDPKDAVVYFFPAQAMENQRYSLCCQLVGVAKFFKATFSSPSLVVLDQGKFAFHWSGKYLLVLGGSLDVSDNILKRHLSFLCGIFCFYHGSVNILLKECKSNREEFLTKMELAWSRYITLARCYDNLLQLCLNPLPLTIYKKHSNAVLKANQLLHLCQLSSSVLAGAVFCSSRVLSSQLTPELTSFLALMSNANAASPVSNVSDSTARLPPDVDLKYVYLSKKVIQNILKYNHIYVGNRVRVKHGEVHSKQLYPLTHCYDVSSGSEGDVDSGNCSENIHENRSKKDELVKEEPKKANHMLQNYLKSFNYIKCVSCCQTHIALYDKSLHKSQNHNCLKLLPDCNVVSPKLKMPQDENVAACSKMKSQRISQNVFQYGKTFGLYVSPINLLCHHHAYLWAETFVAKVQCGHLNLMSSCDLEFACCMCVHDQPELSINTFALKRWNSDINILDFSPLISLRLKCNSHNSRPSLNSIHGMQSSGKKRKICKIQVLKCRSKKDRSGYSKIKHNFFGHPYTSKHFSEDSLLYDSKEKRIQSRSKFFHFPTDFCDKPNNCENVESNEFEKTVLYVQRCGINTLLLFINKNYDEEILNYLWNCGFSLLKDLECETETLEKYCGLETSYYILLCNNVQKILKEHPSCPASTFADKCSKELVQVIQEDFLVNPDFHMISLLTTNENIFACQTKQHSAFYLQPDMNSRKLESLSNLSKKAVRRLDKFLKLP